MDTHKFYKEKVESSLSKAIGRNIEAGIWKYTRKDVFGNYYWCDKIALV